MSSIDDRGSFYLGRLHDLAAGETSETPLQYASKDLTTHAVCVGMTGSGKTGLCLSLIEEAALDGVPVIAIDPKGDLGNLLLTFPELRGEDFLPWVDRSAAERKGKTPEEFAADTATLWRDGLAQWGQGPELMRRFVDGVDRAIYTPGSTAGLPLTVLRSFAAPPAEVLEDSDAFVDRVQAAASGVLALLGIDADPVRSREHILLSNVLQHHWQEGRDLDLPGLIGQIQSPPMEKVGALDIETFYPASDRLKLGMQLNNLLASPSFQSWLRGEPLDIGRLLHTAEGKPRVSILSIAHLSDAERMFFVTLLLSELITWMRAQPGTSSLRAILYMDEVFGYFPPTANPPSKRPMLTLLKQARAFGVGCVLATQNPVDLDYKGLSNAGTWLLGRLQTERDKARVIEGLEGASAEAGSAFDKQAMERTLAGLGGRVFLMNNVHDDRPAVFHTRWAMSYLRGPLTRDQIRLLMADRKGEAVEPEPVEAPEPEASEPSATGVPSGIEQLYWVDPEGAAPESLRPALLGRATIKFEREKFGVDHEREVCVLSRGPWTDDEDVWAEAEPFEQSDALSDAAPEGVALGGLPAAACEKTSYTRWRDALADKLYESEECVVLYSKELDAASEPGEERGAFLARHAEALAKLCAAEHKELEERYRRRMDEAEERVRKAEAHLSTQRSQFWTRAFSAVFGLIPFLLGLFGLGSKRRLSTGGVTGAMKEREQQQNAQQRLDARRADLEALKKEIAEHAERIDERFSPAGHELEEITVRPLRKASRVEPVAVLWMG